ncbi:MAG: LysE family translocator [Limisphaerales bacterium]
MTLLSALTLFVVMSGLAAIPSASVALVVTRGAAFGVRSGAAVAAGIVLGDLVFVAFAIFGLHAIAEAMGSFFAVVRYAGGAYLIWMGVGLIRSRGKDSPRPDHPGRSTLLASFLSGFALTLGDVKAILFYASLFPAFVHVTSLGLGDAAAVVLITITAVGGVKLAYAFAARGILLQFETKEREEIALSMAGTVLVGTGACVIAKT